MGKVNEVWKPISGWPLYEVSDLGRVRSTATHGRIGRVLKPVILNSGYAKVTLCNGPSVRQDLLVHRIVALTFLGLPPKGHEVNHLDFDRSNNRLSNLEWVTRSYNTVYSMLAGRKIPPDPSIRCRGQRWHELRGM